MRCRYNIFQYFFEPGNSRGCVHRRERRARQLTAMTATWKVASDGASELGGGAGVPRRMGYSTESSHIPTFSRVLPAFIASA